MSKVGLLQIRANLIRAHGRCCSICFCPATERRLVKPEFLNTLLSKLSKVVLFKNDVQVCFMCEGLAKSALRFVKAVELASKVGELMSEVTKEQWLVITQVLELKAKPGRPRILELNKECPQRRALALDKELRSSRHYQLFKTETLVVSSRVFESNVESAPAVPQRSKVVLLMQHKDPLPIFQPILPPLSPIITPILPPTARAVTSRLPHLSIDPDRKHVRVENKDTNEFILHPIVTGVDGKIYVPSLQLQIAENGILKSVDSSHIRNIIPSTFVETSNKPNLTYPPSPNLKSPNLNPTNLKSPNLNPTNLKSPNLNSTNLKPPNLKSTYLNSAKLKSTNLNSTVTKRVISVDPLEQNNEKSAYYNFLVSQMKQKRELNVNNVEVIESNDMNIVLNVEDDDAKCKKKRKTAELDQTLSDVAHLLQENAHGACEIKYEIIDDDDEVPSGNQDASNQGLSGNQGASNQGYVSSKSGSGNRVTSDTASKGAGSSSKEPVLKTDRTVDWEDKIPMDVISFMYATDPNPQERIMQPPPMAVISDVRSVPDVPDIECIDLC